MSEIRRNTPHQCKRCSAEVVVNSVMRKGRFVRRASAGCTTCHFRDVQLPLIERAR